MLEKPSFNRYTPLADPLCPDCAGTGRRRPADVPRAELQCSCTMTPEAMTDEEFAQQRHDERHAYIYSPSETQAEYKHKRRLAGRYVVYPKKLRPPADAPEGESVKVRPSASVAPQTDDDSFSMSFPKSDEDE